MYLFSCINIRQKVTINTFISSIFDSQAGKLKGCLFHLIPTCPCCSFIFLLGTTFTFSNFCTTDTFTWKITFGSPYSTKGGGKKISVVMELNLQHQKSQTCKTRASRRHLLKAQTHKELNIASLFPCMAACVSLPPSCRRWGHSQLCSWNHSSASNNWAGNCPYLWGLWTELQSVCVLQGTQRLLQLPVKNFMNVPLSM